MQFIRKIKDTYSSLSIGTPQRQWQRTTKLKLSNPSAASPAMSLALAYYYSLYIPGRKGE
jgi:hypothetical protein